MKLKEKIKVKNNQINNMFKKYELFLKYGFSGGTSFALDILLFAVFNSFLKNIFGPESIIISTILARIISSIYNFFINSKYVFKNYDIKMIIKYYILVFIQMFVSAGSVYLINLILSNVASTYIKIVVDIIIFIINFFIQKKWVFK